MSTDKTSRFQQARKETAKEVESQVRACLCDYYNTPPKRVVNAEHERDGAYETAGEYQVTDFLDYAGVDWLVDVQPAIVPVGERVRPNKENRRDFSLRLDNGTTKPCETDRLGAGLNRGIAPTTLLFGWQTGENLDRAWLLDMSAFMDALRTNLFELDERQTGDGTVAGYVPIGDLAANDVVVASWTDPQSHSEAEGFNDN